MIALVGMKTLCKRIRASTSNKHEEKGSAKENVANNSGGRGYGCWIESAMPMSDQSDD